MCVRCANGSKRAKKHFSRPLSLQQLAPDRPSALVVAAALCAALGGVLFGYDAAVVSGALLPLAEEFALDTLHKVQRMHVCVCVCV